MAAISELSARHRLNADKRIRHRGRMHLSNFLLLSWSQSETILWLPLCFEGLVGEVVVDDRAGRPSDQIFDPLYPAGY